MIWTPPTPRLSAKRIWLGRMRRWRRGFMGLPSLAANVAILTATATQTATFGFGTPASNSSSSFELGLKFSSSSAGTISTLKFYRYASSTVTSRTVRLWNGDGTLKTSATTSGESGSGWKSVSISPQSITAGANYVVSYSTGNSYWVYTINYFTAPVTSGPLTAPIGAGVYNVTEGSFPATAASNSNYFADLVLAY